ncbi:7218_t:CDS:2 [Dentiscutata heterogama]|uniref:7218_t:CDS:1 n=1 Tax=Dentiscutata heterogama TaxID=1316150 RepID=A0ACA9L9C5_9GLOM|nr:7218_t:CDS:2 [Dentiscutata heterogama]
MEPIVITPVSTEIHVVVYDMKVVEIFELIEFDMNEEVKQYINENSENQKVFEQYIESTKSDFIVVIGACGIHTSSRA